MYQLRTVSLNQIRDRGSHLCQAPYSAFMDQSTQNIRFIYCPSYTLHYFALHAADCNRPWMNSMASKYTILSGFKNIDLLWTCGSFVEYLKMATREGTQVATQFTIQRVKAKLFG